MDDNQKRAANLIGKVVEASPLVQCITNYVSMDIMANTLLAIGASPAMVAGWAAWLIHTRHPHWHASQITCDMQVHSKEEVEDFLKIASALLVNVGTLSPAWVESMQLAASAANELGKPWVLDPVGAGATPFRTQVCHGNPARPLSMPEISDLTCAPQTILALVKLKPTVIRGNASEIMAVAGAAGTTTKGVDSTAESEEALEAGRQLARDVGCVVAITGAVDLVGGFAYQPGSGTS